MVVARISIARSEASTRRAPAWVAAGLLAGALIGSVGCSPAESPEPEGETAEAAAPEAAPVPDVPKPLWQQHIHEIEPQVESWATAWSNQDVDGYLGHYSPDFQVPNGMSREAWDAQRRQRLTRPSEIQVTLAGIRRVGYNKAWIDGKERELVKVRFHQSYASDTFSDAVDKELELELVDLNWKIFTETSF